MSDTHPLFFKTTPLFYHPFLGKNLTPTPFFSKISRTRPLPLLYKSERIPTMIWCCLISKWTWFDNSRLLENAKFLEKNDSCLTFESRVFALYKKASKRYIHLTDLHFPDLINNKNVKKASATWQFVFCYCPLMWAFYCRILKIKLIRFRREP